MSSDKQMEISNPDVLVVGAGPAGMAAAIRAHESGAKVLVLDDNPSAGGQIWRGGEKSLPDSQASRWFAQFRGLEIPLTTSAQVISANGRRQTLQVEMPNRTREYRFGSLVLATGAREIFIPFPGWTLPGVMGVGGLQALAKSGLPISGKEIVVAGSGPLMLAVAVHMKAHGGKVRLIAEQASRAAIARFVTSLVRYPRKAVEAAALQASLLGVPYRYGCWVESADGDGHVQSLIMRQGKKRWRETCDIAAVAFGLHPNVELAQLLNCRLLKGKVSVNEWQETSVANVYGAGECTGIGGVDLSLVEGEIAGLSASGQKSRARSLFRARHVARHFAASLNSAFALRPELINLPQPETIVCRCEDVTYRTLKTAPSFRAAKLQTRCGMGPCQGRICGSITNLLFGWEAESVRPPIFPARIGSLVVNHGEAFQQETPLPE